MKKAEAMTAVVEGYEAWIRSIKERIQRARVKASMLVNSEQTLLYWDIGHEILEKQENEGWGSKVVERMSADLKAAFPDMKGWSRSSLMYMRQFAAAWKRNEIVQAPLGQLPWYHHLALLERLKSRGDRIAYAVLAIENGWSRDVMVHQIELGYADQHGTAITNFKNLMPPADSDMAEQTLKGEYDLGFLPATAKMKENKLRAMLVDKVAKFMIELGAGFDMDLTARENIYMNGAIMGFDRKFMDAHFDEIVAFSELEEFLDVPVKNYSSGMVSRLGFAIATTRDAPDILILDEVLSVGDMFFRKKSEKRIQEMIHGGSTVLIVSHSTAVIEKNCTKVIWIEKGRLRAIGNPKEVCRAYSKMTEEK